MQALQEKQKEDLKWKEILSAGVQETVESRVEHVKFLQYGEHQQLFGVLYTTLHKSAQDGDVSGMKFFLETKIRGRNRVNVDDYDRIGICAIHYASQNGHCDSVDYLMSMKCDVDLRTTDGMTPLMYACRENRLPVIRQLINYGANPLAQNRAGLSAAHFAAQSDHYEALECLVQSYELFKENLTKYMEALANNGGIAPVPKKKAKAKGSKKEEPTEEDTGPVLTDSVLKYLSTGRINSSDVVATELRSLVDIPSNNGTKPMHIAAEADCPRVVTALIRLGAELDPIDTTACKDTPLLKAARTKNYTIYNIMAAAGANQDYSNSIKETPRKLLKDDRYF